MNTLGPAIITTISEWPVFIYETNHSIHLLSVLHAGTAQSQCELVPEAAPRLVILQVRRLVRHSIPATLFGNDIRSVRYKQTDPRGQESEIRDRLVCSVTLDAVLYGATLHFSLRPLGPLSPTLVLKALVVGEQ